MREYPVEATGVGAEKEEGGDEEKRRRVAIRREAANVVIEKTRVRHSSDGGRRLLPERRTHATVRPTVICVLDQSCENVTFYA